MAYNLISKSSSAFTLVELLVTVAIVGILASLAIANFSIFRDSAYNTELASLTQQALIAGEAGLGDGRHGPVNHPDGGNLSYNYRIKFPGLILPDYIGFSGHMINLKSSGFNGRPGFYFQIHSCKLKRPNYGFTFNGSTYPGLGRGLLQATLSRAPCY